MALQFYGVYNQTVQSWLTFDFEFSAEAMTTDGKPLAKPFGTFDNAERFVRLHFPPTSTDWTVKVLPAGYRPPMHEGTTFTRPMGVST